MKKRPLLLAFYVFLSFFIYQATQIRHFGLSADEALVQMRGKTALKAYSELLKGHVEGSRAARASLRKWHQHPSFFASLYFVSNQLLTRKLNWRVPASRHAVLILFSSLALGAFFLLGFFFFGLRIAVFATFLLFGFPAFLGHAQFNPKDIPLIFFFGTALLFFFRARQTGETWRYAMGGLFSGLAMATHWYGLLLPVILGGAWALQNFLWPRKKPSKPPWGAVAASVVIAVGTLFALTPSLWTDPWAFAKDIHVFATLERGDSLYFRKTYASIHLPWHYTLLYLLKATPIPTVVLVIAGFFAAYRSLHRKEHVFEWLVVLLWAGLPVLLQSIPKTGRYDGMRHVLLAVPPLMLLGGAGLDRLFNRFERRWPRFRWAAAVVGTLVAAFYFGEVKEIHPYEAAYQNNVLRWLVPEHSENVMTPEDWQTPMYEGVNWLNEHAEPNAAICSPVSLLMFDDLEIRPDLSYTCEGKIDYVIFLTKHLNRPEVAALKFSQPPVFTVSRYRSDLLRIYRSEGQPILKENDFFYPIHE